MSAILRKGSLCFSILLVLFSQSMLSAFWPFGHKNDWLGLTPAEQTEKAMPYFQEAETYRAQGKLKKAIKSYENVWMKFPSADCAADALFETGRILQQFHEWRDALGIYQKIILLHPDYDRFSDVIQAKFDIATAYAEGDHVRLFGLFPTTDYKKAVAAFEGVVANAPYSDIAPQALMRIAILHRANGNEAEAVDALDRIINNYPRSMYLPDAYLLQANTFAQLVDGASYDQGATREAISYYEDFMILFPDNPAVGIAEKELAKNKEIYARSKLILGEFFYYSRDNYEAAKVFFNGAITLAPESASANKARKYLKVIEAIEKAYPDGNYPRRIDWQRMAFWIDYDPAEAILNLDLEGS